MGSCSPSAWVGVPGCAGSGCPGTDSAATSLAIPASGSCWEKDKSLLVWDRLCSPPVHPTRSSAEVWGARRALGGWEAETPPAQPASPGEGGVLRRGREMQIIHDIMKNLEKPLECQVRTLKCCLVSYKSSSDQGFSHVKNCQCCCPCFPHTALCMQLFAHAPTLSSPRCFVCLDLILHKQMHPPNVLTCRC